MRFACNFAGGPRSSPPPLTGLTTPRASARRSTRFGSPSGAHGCETPEEARVAQMAMNGFSVMGEQEIPKIMQVAVRGESVLNKVGMTNT